MNSQYINKAVSLKYSVSENDRKIASKKSILDNRIEFQSQNALIKSLNTSNKNSVQSKKVTQLATPEEWFGKVRPEYNLPITLYSDIRTDGFGDAGQLGFLRKEMSSMYPGSKIVTYASHIVKAVDDPTSKGVIDPTRKSVIKNLSGIQNDDDIILYQTESPEKKPKYSEDIGISAERGKYDDSWEIQYPVPAREDNGRDQNRILKIFEMGLSDGAVKTFRLNNFAEQNAGRKPADTLFHTGVPRPFNTGIVKNTAIGYGIPNFSQEEKDSALPGLLDALQEDGLDLSNNNIEELKIIFSKAWLVRLNDPSYAYTVLSLAQNKGCDILIFIGDKESIKTAISRAKSEVTKIAYYVYNGFAQNQLTTLFSLIGKEGRIIVGGEGMLVHALGASSDVPIGLLPQQFNKLGDDSWEYKYQMDQYNQDAGGVVHPITGDSQIFLKQNKRARENNWFKKYITEYVQPGPVKSSKSKCPIPLSSQLPRTPSKITNPPVIPTEKVDSESK